MAITIEGAGKQVTGINYCLPLSTHTPANRNVCCTQIHKDFFNYFIWESDSIPVGESSAFKVLSIWSGGRGKRSFSWWRYFHYLFPYYQNISFPYDQNVSADYLQVTLWLWYLFLPLSNKQLKISNKIFQGSRASGTAPESCLVNHELILRFSISIIKGGANHPLPCLSFLDRVFF